MTKKLNWRLSKLPTSDEVLKLVNDKIITKDEAREILFTEVNEKEESLEDAKQEIKFLKELVEKLSDRTGIVEKIRYIEKPYYQWGWYKPYEVWCSSSNLLDTNGTGTMYLSSNNSVNGINATNVSFSAIN